MPAGGRGGRQAPEPGVGPGQPPLDHLPDVEQQVPAVGDLHRLRRACCGATAVLGRAVARDDLDPWAASQPSGERPGRAVRQEVGDPPPLEVDQDGAVRPAFAPRPVVHAQHARRPPGGQRQAADEAQHGVGARRHAEMRQQFRPGLAAEGDADPALGLAEAARASRTRGDQAG
jgi:hypothetical protein